MSLAIREVQTAADKRKFVKMAWDIYKSDPHWMPPLLMERYETLSEKKNPFFEHGEAKLFLAEKAGRVVGRISAHVNRLHNEYHKDKAGFFGFFEAENDPDIARALTERAEGWLRDKGCDKVLGPMCFSTNEGDVGVLIKGFEEPLMIFCSYNPPYYPDLFEKSGYQKAKDLYGWRYKVGDIPEGPAQVAAAVEAHPGLSIRSVDKKQMERDVRIVGDIFNAAWGRNWGYVPWTEREVKYSAMLLKLIIKEEITAIAELEGRPIGMMITLPNIFELIRGLNGRLFPTGIFKLLYRQRFMRYRSARLMLLGVLPEFRGSVLGGLSVLMYVKAHRGGLKLGIQGGELGWTLEDNKKINAGIEFMGGRIGKIYRVYGKDL